ncbi:hypothetical protein DUNSADRAFT_6683 [Dunaliella salina]|uniref:Secreted protein n=1 Tax=Dunaliella salina TaxID=3046 RepID=A0ABQ7GMX9_DUNSA|nr:hypothetical protein DUNSADRAFT_6683 [Dunaliella salina]|eukprot:KAF5835927.1 hypothetical protein DUNSADRAFT_6683 [Dunaliella salina]
MLITLLSPMGGDCTAVPPASASLWRKHRCRNEQNALPKWRLQGGTACFNVFVRERICLDEHAKHSSDGSFWPKVEVACNGFD